MPMTVSAAGLLEAGPLLRRFLVSAAKKPGGVQYSPTACRTDRDDIAVEHHEGQTSISFQWIRVVEVDDRLLLPVLEPVVPRDLTVVLVGLSVALAPLVEFARAGAEPVDEVGGGDLGLLRPIVDKVDDGVACVGRDPAALQISPDFFLARRALA